MSAWLTRHAQTSIGSLGRLSQQKFATLLTVLVKERDVQVLDVPVVAGSLDGFNADLALAFRAFGAAERCGEAAGAGPRDLEHRLVRGNPDRAALILGDVAATAEQRQQPTRIGILVAADIHPEPDGVLEPRSRALLARRRA